MFNSSCVFSSPSRKENECVSPYRKENECVSPYRKENECVSPSRKENECVSPLKSFSLPPIRTPPRMGSPEAMSPKNSLSFSPCSPCPLFGFGTKSFTTPVPPTPVRPNIKKARNDAWRDKTVASIGQLPSSPLNGSPNMTPMKVLKGGDFKACTRVMTPQGPMIQLEATIGFGKGKIEPKIARAEAESYKVAIEKKLSFVESPVATEITDVGSDLIITQLFHEGIPLDQYILENRFNSIKTAQLADKLIEAYKNVIKETGKMCADPRPQNAIVTFDDNGNEIIKLIDFRLVDEDELDFDIDICGRYLVSQDDLFDEAYRYASVLYYCKRDILTGFKLSKQELLVSASKLNAEMLAPFY